MLIQHLITSTTRQWLNNHPIYRHDANKEQRHTMTWQLKLQNYLKSKTDQKFKVQRRELLHCFSCENAVSNEECNAEGLITCQPTQTSCQTEIRVFNPRNRVKVRIKKVNFLRLKNTSTEDQGIGRLLDKKISRFWILARAKPQMQDEHDYLILYWRLVSLPLTITKFASNGSSTTTHYETKFTFTNNCS